MFGSLTRWATLPASMILNKIFFGLVRPSIFFLLFAPNNCHSHNYWKLLRECYYLYVLQIISGALFCLTPLIIALSYSSDANLYVSRVSWDNWSIIPYELFCCLHLPPVYDKIQMDVSSAIDVELNDCLAPQLHKDHNASDLPCLNLKSLAFFLIQWSNFMSRVMLWPTDHNIAI